MKRLLCCLFVAAWVGGCSPTRTEPTAATTAPYHEGDYCELPHLQSQKAAPMVVRHVPRPAPAASGERTGGGER